MSYIKKLITEDNGLSGSTEYVRWNPNSDSAVLDGWFTADQLIAIAEHMKKYIKN